MTSGRRCRAAAAVAEMPWALKHCTWTRSGWKAWIAEREPLLGPKGAEGEPGHGPDVRGREREQEPPHDHALDDLHGWQVRRVAERLDLYPVAVIREVHSQSVRELLHSTDGRCVDARKQGDPHGLLHTRPPAKARCPPT